MWPLASGMFKRGAAYPQTVRASTADQVLAALRGQTDASDLTVGRER
jgi:hypothetical protein